MLVNIQFIFKDYRTISSGYICTGILSSFRVNHEATEDLCKPLCFGLSLSLSICF